MNGELRAQLADQLRNRQNAKAFYQGILKQRSTELAAFAEQSGPDSVPYRNLRDRLREARQQLQRIFAVVKRPISRLSISSKLLFACWLGLAVFEAPINKFLFDVLMNSAGWISLTASLMISGFMLGLAHASGHNLRQVYSDYRAKIVWRALLASIGLVLIAMLILSVLTFARAKLSAQSGTLGELLTGLGESVGELGLFGTIAAILADTSALTLATMNLGGIVVAMALAYFSCDHDIDYDNAQNQVDRLEQKMAQMHGRFLGARGETVRKFEPDLVGYAANYNSANAAIIEIKTRLGLELDTDDKMTLTELDTFASEIETDLAADLAAFRQEATDPSVADMASYRKPSGSA